jgi:hypothetical protein
LYPQEPGRHHKDFKKTIAKKARQLGKITKSKEKDPQNILISYCGDEERFQPVIPFVKTMFDAPDQPDEKWNYFLKTVGPELLQFIETSISVEEDDEANRAYEIMRDMD